MSEHIRVVPANEGSCEDVVAVFGERGSSATCFCQRCKHDVSRPGTRRLVMRIEYR